MSFSRTIYDKCAYDLQMNRSVAPGDYRLFAPFAENCEQCFSNNGPIGAKSDVSLVKQNMDLTNGLMAETESELSWRGQRLQECNNNTDPFSKHPLVHKENCSKQLIAEDSRFTNPIDNYRCMSLTSYMVEPYLYVNPQCHIQSIDDRMGLNSRLHVKDMYQMPETEMLDIGEALPKVIGEEVDANAV